MSDLPADLPDDTPTERPAPSLTPAELADAPRAVLVPGATELVGRCRAGTDPTPLATLAALRRVLLLRNERPALALALRAQGEVATAAGHHATAADAYDTEWGVRELLEQPFRAHRARLDHGEALFRAGKVAEAEQVLRAAQQPARELALGGRVTEAADALADTLARLAALLQATGRTEEAELWLEGARDLAPDAESRERVDAALSRLSSSSGTGRRL